MKRLWLAFLYSLEGLRAAWQTEQAFRLELLLMLVLVPVAYVLAPDNNSLLLMLASLVLVLICELVNTAVEAAIDRICVERHPLSKKAKDTASAAVLLAVLLVLLIWGTVLWRVLGLGNV